MDASEEAAADAATIVPDGWVNVGAALAWIAFGTAKDDTLWNDSFYFGASRWFGFPPTWIAEDLRELIEHDVEPFVGTFAAPELTAALHSAVRTPDVPESVMMSEGQADDQHLASGPLVEIDVLKSRAEALIGATEGEALSPAEFREKAGEALLLLDRAANIARAYQSRLSPSQIEVREAASRLLASLEAQGPVVDRTYSALWRASETLRRAIGSGDVLAYGWPSTLSNDEARDVAPARQRIPQEICCAPVTVTQNGILAFARGYDFPDTFIVLWHGVLIDAPDLLRLRPAAEGDAPVILYRPAEPEGRRRGGRPPKHDWQRFQHEVSRRLAKDGPGPTMTAFRKNMKDWAAENILDPPDDRTIERRLDELVPRDLFPTD